MTARRTLTALAVMGTAPFLFTALVAAPADAHGALDNPVSRTAACGSEGGQNARSAACRAAIAMSDPRAPADWANLRVPGVNGRDREVIPDGKLCSGGKPEFRGLDLARADWPTTSLTAGADFTFRYRETIPHQGTFRMYVTRDGYQPTKPLAWADLESKPFLTATDPELRNDEYVMRGRLPAGKSGRHLIYTIWQNSSTPDTYYSCSDVVFGGAAGSVKGTAPGTAPGGVPGKAPGAVPGKARGSAPSGAPSSPGSGSTGGPATPANQPASGAGSSPALAKASHSSPILPWAGGVSAVVALALGAGALLRRRRS